MSDQLQLFPADRFQLPTEWEQTAEGQEVCHLCRQERTPEGHDPCIARTPGVLFACCGHGLREPYVVLVAVDGPQSEVEYFRQDAAGEVSDLSRGESLYGAEAAAKLRQLQGPPAQ